MNRKRFLIVIIIALIVFFVSFFWIQNVVGRGNLIYSIDSTPEKQTALVLGARVWNNGDMSDIFKDRVITAINLYEDDKVEKILVSGDHGQDNYDEVNAAKRYLLEQGVNPEDIFLDHAGFDTYDSLYRAKEIFQVDSLVVVTQDFHLDRALYIADNLNMDAVGVSADRHKYVGENYRNRREKLATIKAYLNVMFKVKPKFLGSAIPITGDSRLSWD